MNRNFKNGASIIKHENAKTNRPAVICEGCNGGPSVSVPNVFAINVVAATRLLAISIITAPLIGLGANNKAYDPSMRIQTLPKWAPDSR